MRALASILIALVLASSVEAKTRFRRKLGASIFAGPGVTSSTIDYTTSLYLTAPSGAALCADAAITTDQGAAITVTRASSATCEREQGLLVALSNNRPIVETDGLGVWPSSSNRLAFSENIEVQWTPTNASAGTTAITSPTGATINNLATTSAGGYFESGGFTITGTSAVLSVFIKGAGTESVNATLYDATAGALRCTISATAPADWPLQKSRPSCSSAAIVSGNTHVVRVYPGGTGGSSSSDIYFDSASVEPGITVKTPYIPTAGTAATRAADNISTTIADINAAGCFSATFWSTVAAFPRSIATNPSTLAQYNNTVSMLANDGVNTATSNSVSNMTDRSTTVRTSWGGSTFKTGLDGLYGSNQTFDGSMSGTTTLYVGSLSGTSRHFGGWLYRLKVSTDANGCSL